MLVVALALIFFASLGLRLEPMLDAQPVVRAFDPWFQLKVTNYVSENGFGAFFSWYDDSTWVPFGRDMTTTSYIGVPFTSAFFFWILNGLGISVDILYISLVLPAFMGALTAIVAFFLGREISNNTVGLFSALFLGFMPAFIQRTIVGFYDNEAVGVFAVVITLFFFTRSLKRGSLPSGIAAGLSLAYLLASWGAGDFMLGLFAMYAFFMLASGRYSQRLLSSYTLTLAIGLFLGALVPRNGFGALTSFTYLAALGMGVLLAGYEIWLRIGGYRETTATALAPHIKPILLGIIAPVVGVTGYLIYAGSTELSISTTSSNPFNIIGGKFLSVIDPFFRLDQRIFASVAEHLPSPWASFYHTLLVLIIFFPLGLYFVFRRGRDEDLLMLLFGVTTVYFTGSMIRLSLILAPAVAVLAAIAVNGIIVPFGKVVTQQSVFERRRFRMSSSLTSEHAIAVFAFVGLLLSVNVLLGVSYATDGISNPEFAPSAISGTGGQITDWQTAMNYIQNVLPDDAVIASWWDYGYWINGAAGAQTIVDNATFNSTQIAKMGYALMSLNLTESLKTFKDWNTTHVLVYWGHRHPSFGGDDGKWPWMVRIAEDNLGSDVIDDLTYLGDNPATNDVEETDYTLDAFFQSTLYKLMLYGEPRDQTQGQEMGLTNTRLSLDQYYIDAQDTRWIENIPQTLYGAFEPAFWSSQFATVKLYSIDYTMLEQYENRTQADWTPERGSLDSVSMDGDISDTENDFQNYDVVFGGGYEATVYTESNDTHLYYGIHMDNYTLGEDAFGLEIAPIDSALNPDIRIVNYGGEQYYDGHLAFTGEWALDSSGANSSLFATGENTIEFIIPLNSDDPQDINLQPGMNYRIKLMFWHNADSGEPTFDSDWFTFWVPVELY
jgi:dolichyl-diphosphooligosaccharide--protein glycosyltransferase